MEQYQPPPSLLCTSHTAVVFVLYHAICSHKECNQHVYPTSHQFTDAQRTLFHKSLPGDIERCKDPSNYL